MANEDFEEAICYRLPGGVPREEVQYAILEGLMCFAKEGVPTPTQLGQKFDLQLFLASARSRSRAEHFGIVQIVIEFYFAPDSSCACTSHISFMIRTLQVHRDMD